MKIHFLSRSALAGLAVTAALLCSPLPAIAESAGESTPSITVDWTDPAQFSEVRVNGAFDWTKPEIWLGQFRSTVESSAVRVLAPGQRLEVTFTDVMLAGRFEPGPGPALINVRMLRSIYPPQIDLTFSLLDADGHVVESGTRVLRDLAYLTRGTASSGIYRFEKRMLHAWVAREFRKTDA